MVHFLFILSFIFTTSLLGTTAATTENEPSALVNGVNVITGDLYLSLKDLSVHGLEPIHLQRHYISQKGLGYWNMFPYHRAFADFDAKNIEIIEPSGARIFYRWDEKRHKNKTVRTFHPVDLKEENSKGVTNTARGKISGKTNLKNQNIHMSSSQDRLSVVCPDGTRRVYEREKNFAVDEFMDWNISSLPSYRTSYLLVKEELPNGRQVRYEWPKNKKDVWKIKTCDPTQLTTYSWVKFYPHNGSKKRSHGDYGVETSDGRHLEYSFFSHNKIHQLKAVSSDESPTKTYEYISSGKRKLLSSVILPQQRFSDIRYYTPGEHFGKSYDENDPVCYRVKELASPSGDNSKLITTHRFFYDLPNKKTTVLDPYDVPTEYFWNDDLRLTKINRYTSHNILYNQERFIWGDNESSNASNLICKILLDENESPIFATRYEYDSYGNIEKETIYGNLTGEGAALQLDSKGLPVENGVESYSKKKSYSNDEKNLLLFEEEENGLSTSYKYYDKTPLIETQIQFADGVPQIRHHSKYYLTGILSEKTIEDLQGNFYVKNYFLNRSELAPYSRDLEYMYPKLPFCIETSYGREQTQLFSRSLISYASGGHVLKKEVFESGGGLIGFSSNRYSRGCLISETNILNQEATSQYDEFDNLISSRDFGGRLTTEVTYDQLNRPISSKESGEGLERSLFCKYDDRGHKVEAYDFYNNKTSYEYDSLGNLLKTYPPSGGVISCEYDALGNIISLTDAKGNTTKTKYSAYKKPIQITHANGYIERFLYDKSGNLKTHIDQEGIETNYTYDAFGRVLTKETPYSKESLTYDSFNVLSTTDAEGIVTNYTYDALGRKTVEQVGEEALRYAYDHFGRLHRITSGEFSHLKFYNELSQLTKEVKVDALDHPFEFALFEYDSAGNRISIERQVNGVTTKEYFEYDPFNRLITHIDPLGHATKTIYNDHRHEQTTIDPLNLQIVQSFNADNTLIGLQKYSPEGSLLLSESYNYDLNKNLTQKVVTSSSLCNVTNWEYNEMDELILLIEGTHSPEEKRTHYSYTPKGRVEQITKPNGVTLNQTYSAVGDIETQTSSDGTIYYSYAHFRDGLLKSCKDELSGATISRSYTPQGRLLNETLPGGLSIENSYDYMGRRRLLTLPDRSAISYDYDALYLRGVSRIKNNKTLYTHSYTSYDQTGNLLEETTITGLPISHQYNSLGKHTQIHSNYFSEKITAFDATGNVLEKIRNQDRLNFSYDSLYQLNSENSHTYRYDSQYNRLQKDGDSFKANTLNQTSELSYNSNGNPTSWKGKKLSYDALDRLTKVEDQDKTIHYTYDCFHRRLSKKVYESGTLTADISYLYDDENEIGAFDNLNQQFVELRILGNTRHAEAGSSIALELHGITYMPLHDLQGNIVGLFNLSDGSYESYSYSAFGELESGSFNQNPWLFSSKRYDVETELVYYGKRYYIPELGRWLTSDPLGPEAGNNLYAFVLNAPLVHYDLYGLFEIEDKASNTIVLRETSFNAHSKSQNTEASTYTVGSKEIPGLFILMINGINTTRDEAMNYARSISDLGDGIKVRGIYNPTNGPARDVGGACLGMLGKERHATALLAKTCQEFLDLYKNGPEIALITCHSDGATHVYNYLKSQTSEIQKRFIVLAIAPATVISKEICFDSFNYASKKDFVPKIRYAAECNAAIKLGYYNPKITKYLDPSITSYLKQYKELEFLTPAKGTDWLDHSFDSPTFTRSKRESISTYFNIGKAI
jgi:RHS repeat-associated protein